MSKNILSEKRKYRTPDESEIKTLYQFYKLIFDSGFSLPKKRSIMTAVLGYETWSWRVVAITEEAVKAIARNGFKKPAKELSRDHAISRAETCKKIFEREKAMELKTWWDYVFENDETTLMTNTEHHSINKHPPSKKYEINPEDSLFIDAEVAGWYQSRGREGVLLSN